MGYNEITSANGASAVQDLIINLFLPEDILIQSFYDHDLIEELTTTLDNVEATYNIDGIDDDMADTMSSHDWDLRAESIIIIGSPITTNNSNVGTILNTQVEFEVEEPSDLVATYKNGILSITCKRSLSVRIRKL